MRKEIFDNLDNLPSLPVIVEKLQTLLSDPRTTVDDVAKLMSTDQALVTRLLRLVNSAFYGLPGRISTIPHAISLLGFTTLRNLVISVSVMGWQKPNSGSLLSMKDFWMHSAAVGAIARVLARHTKLADPDEAFVAGLLHDIGRVAFQTLIPEEYNTIIEMSKVLKKPLHMLEQKAFGFDHAEIGTNLVAKWNLPEIYKITTQHHHHPKLGIDPLAWIVHLADPMAKCFESGSSGSPWISQINEDCGKALNLSPEDLEATCRLCLSEIDKAAIIISIF
jgi:putative nucleotidyltransferase with HDIG domain